MANRRKPTEMRQRGARTLDIGLVAAPEAGAVVVPEPPGGLLKSTRATWGDYWHSRASVTIDPLSDWQRVTRWILYVDEFARLIRAIRKERLGVGSQGQTVLNPLWVALGQVESALQRAETDLGLGPSSRLKLGMQVMESTMTIQQLRDRLDRQGQERQDNGPIDSDDLEVIDLDALAPTPGRARPYRHEDDGESDDVA